MKKYLSRGLALSKRSASNGFTLIELLVVIAIIGILAGVVLTSLGSARNKAKLASVQATMSAMRAEAELGTDENGAYPEDLCVGTAPGRLGRMIQEIRDYIGDPVYLSEANDVQVRCTSKQVNSNVTGVYDYNYGNEEPTEATAPAGSSLIQGEANSTWRVFVNVDNLQPEGADQLFCVDSSGFTGFLNNFSCDNGYWYHWQGTRCLCEDENDD